MDRDEALARLPEPYAIALRLHLAGVTDAQLAVGFGIEPRSVASFLKIAEVKLDQLSALEL